MLNFSIADKKNIFKNNKKIITHWISACSLIAKCFPINYTFDVNIINSNQMHIINKKHRKVDKDTDVISFAFHDAKDIKSNLLGEIFINHQRAKKQAKEYGHSYEREMTFLFIHGVLHLLGYDHIKSAGEQKMNKLQNSLMKQLNLLK